jgi:hypothetical protein
MNNAKTVPLLLEAISNLIANPHNDLQPLLQTALDTLSKNLLYNDHGLMNRIDAALPEKQSDIEWQWSEGGWCAETAASIRIEHNYNARCWMWSVSGNANSEEAARRIASAAARNAK